MLSELASDLLPPEAIEWRSAFSWLRLIRPPYRYLNPPAWANIHEVCTDFISDSVPKLLRMDWCGVMMIDGRKAAGIEPDRIPFGNLIS